MDNDYELLYLAKENNEDAIELLYQKYFRTIYIKVTKYCKIGELNFDDYMNIGNLAFYNAIDNYHDNYAFSTYINSYLNNAMNNYHKSLERNKNKTLNDAISLDDILNFDNIPTDDRSNPETILLAEESYENLRNKIITKLTWDEELVFSLREQNYSPREISEIMDNNIKKIYNIIKRIQNKISSIVSSSY